MNLGLKMDLEYILEHIRDVFTGQPMVRSILARGSVATGEYVPGKSDIDITAVMEDYDFLSAHELRKDIAELSKQVGVRISVTYTNINELEQDINSGLHYHGSKCCDYSKEIANAKLIYGEDLRSTFDKFDYFDIPSMLHSVSKKIADYQKRVALDEHAGYRKGINYVFIVAKQILKIEGKDNETKPELIESFKYFNPEMGSLLEKFYFDSLNFENVDADVESLENMYNFLVFCRKYISDKLIDRRKTYGQDYCKHSSKLGC